MLSSFLAMLESEGIEHTVKEITRPGMPRASIQVEVFNRLGFGDDDITSIWLFDTDGTFLTTGAFQN